MNQFVDFCRVLFRSYLSFTISVFLQWAGAPFFRCYLCCLAFVQLLLVIGDMSTLLLCDVIGVHFSFRWDSRMDSANHSFVTDRKVRHVCHLLSPVGGLKVLRPQHVSNLISSQCCHLGFLVTPCLWGLNNLFCVNRSLQHVSLQDKFCFLTSIESQFRRCCHSESRACQILSCLLLSCNIGKWGNKIGAHLGPFWAPFEDLHRAPPKSRLFSTPFSFKEAGLKTGTRAMQSSEGFHLLQCCPFDMVSQMDEMQTSQVKSDILVPSFFPFESGGRTCRYDRCYWKSGSLGSLVCSLESLSSCNLSILIILKYENGSVAWGSLVFHPGSLGLWPFRGIRVGEAQNPGPKSDVANRCQITIGIVNPTAVYSKTPTLLDFMKCSNSQILALAETSATEGVQKRVGNLLSRKKVSTIWSDPVQPLRDTLHERASARGKASGTAVVSSLPIRKSRLPRCPQFEIEPRVVHTVAQIGTTHFQLVAFYGFAHSQSNPKATKRTSKLLQFVLDRLGQTPLPFVICGDFNLEPATLPCWPLFQQKGAVDLATLHQRLYASEMPMTCQGATRPDTAVLSKDLVPFISQVRVFGDDWFSVHSPVTFTLTLPTPQLFRPKLRLPESWVAFGPEVHQLEQTFDRNSEAQVVESFEQWGRLVDETVDQWIRHECNHNPLLPCSLPKRYKGRCQPTKVIQQPIVSQLRKARDGDFEPADEILSIATKRIAKQIRRIQSLLSRLKKDPTPHLRDKKFLSWLCR